MHLRIRSRFFFSLLSFSALVASLRAQNAVALTSTNSLIAFDVAAPGAAAAPVPITGLGSGEILVGLDYRPVNRVLVGVTSQSRLVVLNPMTGVATPLSTLSVPLAGTSFGVDFNPAADRLRIVSNTGQDLRVNVETGAVIVDGTLAYAAGDSGASATPQIAAAAYTNSVAGRLAPTTTLFDIDYARDVLVRQDPPNNGTLVTIGALGVDFSANSDLDIFSPTLAYAVNSTGAASSLYRINLTTGAATLVGAFPVGTLAVDFSIEPKEPALGIINTSARGLIAPGEGVVITGFVVGGTAPVNVLVVARGPSLTAFGVVSAIADTRVTLYRGATALESNDDWQTHARATEIMATTFAPGSPRESALLATLAPGAYTAVVSGAGTAVAGVALVEVYELP
ncbi:MAG: DUF4394 domain-containing protein [Opitutaceae bacterium]|nr:DUF4394 domain-containing protein [Opitutaceae bacterium]